VLLAMVCLHAAGARAAVVSGTIRDASGGVLPGVTVEVRTAGAAPETTVTDAKGAYIVSDLVPGRYQIVFTLINFATVKRDADLQTSARIDAVMPLALNADVTVTGKRTFANLADVENPAENLVGIAQSASQGAITAKQLEQRPLMRQGEVLETVPGVIVTQHSGEGKANQYFLRGFNLDHGTDLATTVAGLPVNLPTHAHGQGYTDLNFLIPELVAGVQFSKGPYYADQGDFATAGSSNVNYANVLDKSIAHLEVGGEGYARGVFAASPQVGSGHLVAALEVAHNDGPWEHPDDYRKVNGVLRYSRGDAVSGFSLTALGYHGSWNSTDQIPARAIESGAIGRFGAVDPSDGGHSYRYGGIADWQHANTSGDASTRATGYAAAYDLDLFSNFTYDLDDPVHGDQIEQGDHRVTYGGKVTHRRTSRWGDRSIQNTFGVQVRTDDIGNVALYHTQARVRLSTTTQASVVETMAGAFVQNEAEWAPWLRTTAGLRVDGAWFRVDDAVDAVNSGSTDAALVSPKAGVMLGPWRATELYVNAGSGFHSNDARGTTITRNPDGTPAQRVTPLVRATGAEVGVRSVVIPHLQTTLSLWTLHLDSELVFSGDRGTTEPSRPSDRHGVEFANYVSPAKWLTFDADVSWSNAMFSVHDPAGDYVPEAVGTVVSAGATVDGYRKVFGSLRWRYFGPRALIEDNSVRSQATSLVNLQVGYAVARNVKLAVDVFNLFNAPDSDIDYFYTSRLAGEPVAGIEGIHTHPTLPRSARLSLIVGF
jgi:outer membrane receptor protein involved in Fe transport